MTDPDDEDESRGRPRQWTVLRCPRCDQAIMSESEEVVETLLAAHIEICGPEAE